MSFSGAPGKSIVKNLEAVTVQLKVLCYARDISKTHRADCYPYYDRYVSWDFPRSIRKNEIYCMDRIHMGAVNVNFTRLTVRESLQAAVPNMLNNEFRAEYASNQSS